MNKKTKNKKPSVQKTASVIGLGYMGLPTACLLTQAGYKVIGIDINKKKVDALKRGSFKSTEPGMEELFKKAFGSGNFSFSTEMQPADIFVIAVPTPAQNKRMDLNFVISATINLVDVLEKDNLVIVESTIAPNTCKKIIKPILDQKNIPYYLAHCPERAIPGNTLYELTHNDRIIGGIDEKSEKMTESVYQKFVKGQIFTTDITTAEAVKLLENSYRDVNIAFANEIAKLSKKININPWRAIELANRHPRVDILKPGPGVGGHCIPVDPWFLVQDDSRAKFIRLARNVNDSMPEHIVKYIEQLSKKQKPRIAVLGVAYKSNVDDARETPATEIIKLMKQRGWEVTVTDPYVKEYNYPILKLEEALVNADGMVLITDHDNYKKFDFSKYKLDFVFDPRNAFKKEQFNKDTKLVTFGEI